MKKSEIINILENNIGYIFGRNETSSECFDKIADEILKLDETVENFADDFNELWSIHKKGNRKTAQERFNKVVKKVPLEKLKSILSEYIKSNDFQYLKGLDVWLNPEKCHWEDPIVYKNGKPRDGEHKTMVF
jgi:hypothetical protein